MSSLELKYISVKDLKIHPTNKLLKVMDDKYKYYQEIFTSLGEIALVVIARPDMLSEARKLVSELASIRYSIYRTDHFIHENRDNKIKSKFNYEMIYTCRGALHMFLDYETILIRSCRNVYYPWLNISPGSKQLVNEVCENISDDGYVSGLGHIAMIARIIIKFLHEFWNFSYRDIHSCMMLENKKRVFIFGILIRELDMYKKDQLSADILFSIMMIEDGFLKLNI